MDDDEDTLVTLGILLRAQGFDPWPAATGGDALRLAALNPDVVVLDVTLPDTTGIEVCRRLRSDPDTSATPVLMVSGHAVDPDSHVAGLEVGADAYLTKPVDPSVLIASIRAMIRVRRAEERLREREAFLRSLIDHLPCGLFWKDRRSVFLGCNEVVARMIGVGSPADLIGKSDRDLPLIEGEADLYMARDRQVMESGLPLLNQEETVKKADGSTADLLTSKVPLKDSAGAVVGVLGMYLDVTERNRLERHVEHTTKMEAVGQLAGGVAHDFNNLLTVINGYGLLVAERLPEDHPVLDLVKEMIRAGERAAGLTRQLLTFSRQAVVTPRVLDLNAVIAELDKMLRRVIGEDVVLSLHLQPRLGLVEADPGQIEQVIMNLVLNARDAMPTGGQLTIETREAILDEGYAASRADVRPGEYVLLAVSDSGTGMTQEVQSRIFEPFFTTKPIGRGTGLGLATVHGIVRQAGGHVAVYSEVGRGTTFKVYLPRVAGAEGQKPSDAAHAQTLPRGTETILLVEDEDGVRAFTRRVLLGCGYQVLEAREGADALRVALANPGCIRLLVTDVVMPGSGGRELADWLAGLIPGMKVLFLSGYADDAIVRHGILEEKVNFLHKPFTPVALARKVREVLDGLADEA